MALGMREIDRPPFQVNLIFSQIAVQTHTHPSFTDQTSNTMIVDIYKFDENSFQRTLVFQGALK